MPLRSADNHAVVCLGSNTPDAPERIARAVGFLSGLGEIERMTPVYESEPEYAGESVPYHNQIVWLASPSDYECLSGLVRGYQGRVRTETEAQPLVSIDLDIVEWNGRVLRPKDAAAAYFRKGLSLLTAE